MRVLTAFGGHDASATILNDGKIEFYFKEERYSRKKHSTGLDNIFKLLFEKNLLKGIDFAAIVSSDPQEVMDQRRLILRAHNPKIKFVSSERQHHLFHASNAFYNSGFDKAIVIAIDSAGAYLDDDTFESESVYVAEYPNKFTPILKRYWTSKNVNAVKERNNCKYVCNNIRDRINIGNLYNSAALSIGQTVDDCGKAMGLSSYGSSIPWMDLSGSDTKHHIRKYFKDYEEILRAFDINQQIKSFKLDITKNNYKFFADYCYEVQKQCQDEVIQIVNTYVEQTGIKKVCLSGGYAMNIVTNYELVKRFPDVQFYFEPICDDSGISIGAAMNIYRNIAKDKKIYPIQSTSYHGVLHDVSQYIGDTVEVKDLANILYQNKSVGIFYGHAEAGQRALGNRSILFNALNTNAREIVNKIKKREWYRPFAAMVLEEDAHLYFDNIVPSPFMTVSFPVKSDIISGVSHVDGTCRIQTINKNHFLYDLLIEFKQLTGHGILLNTSFNLAGQPLVETPDEAFSVLNDSSLDYLWFYETKQLFNSTF